MWEQIRANRRRAVALITLMGTVLLIIGYAAGELIAPGAGILGLGCALVIFFIQIAVYYGAAETMLLHGANVVELKREDSPRLFNIVEEMKLASGLEFMPKIYLIDDPAPNAFSMGRKPGNYVVAVTSGLVHRLNRDELEGVIAHEMAHLKNHDVQFMTLAAVMLGSIVILAAIVRQWLWFGGGRRRGRSESRGGGGGQAQLIILALGLIFLILGPLMAQILYFACSRKREFLADACGAQFTRYPEGLASALEKISAASATTSFASQATAPLFIVNPLYAGGGEPDSVFSSHPSTAERIRILRGMSGSSLVDYETAYHKAAQGALFSRETLGTSQASAAIRAPSDEGPIETRHDTRAPFYRTRGYLKVKCDCGMEISVPEGYEGDEITCIRCGSVLPLPAASETPTAASLPTATGLPPVIPSLAPPLQYRRAGTGWESLRCVCGRTIQLSPSFAASHIQCDNCGRNIQIV
jgi:heat shock protein HtpX